jgi:ketosteroid isomerase-like protein
MAEIERTTVDIHTVISDVRETIVGDVGWVTCWLEQDATVEGERSHVVGPASLVFRREDGVWLISLFHSVALPQT